MKLISLNAWRSERKDDLENFIKDESLTTDVFCFQEAVEDIKELLPEYKNVNAFKPIPDDEGFSSATFFKPNLILKGWGKLLEKINLLVWVFGPNLK